MRYQWGRKDPFTFPTTSVSSGKYPVKIYTIDGVLIYQDDKGSSNKDKKPAGGIIESLTVATSMMEAIKNPNTIYVNPIINQSGDTKDLYNYYWISYSRGTDGDYSGNKMGHNNYLYGYKSQQVKSIYDPCPYGFRVQANGVWNYYKASNKWNWGSYYGGVSWLVDGIKSWFTSLGCRKLPPNSFYDTAAWMYYTSSTTANQGSAYTVLITVDQVIYPNRSYPIFYGRSVRCIKFCIFATLVSLPRLTEEMLMEQLLQQIMLL